MSSCFVESDWRLVSERLAQLEGEPEDQDHCLRVFLTSYEDGREIWATRREVVELRPESNKVVRRFSLESVSQNDLKVSIPAPLCDETGSYIVLHRTYLNRTFLWRLDLRPNLELRSLGWIYRISTCAVSVDGNWIAGIQDGLLPEYWRCRLDCGRQNDALCFETSELCPLMNFGEPDQIFSARVFGIDESGCVWFCQTYSSRTAYGRWPCGSSPIEFMPSFADPIFDVHSNSTFRVRSNPHSDQAQIHSLVAEHGSVFSLDWPVDCRNERPFSNVCSLLKMSTRRHRDALRPFMRQNLLFHGCVLRWNDNRSRIGISWHEDVPVSNEQGDHVAKKRLFSRVELRVVNESDSLTNACAARIARYPMSENWNGLPTELQTLVENFRNAGCLLTRKE